MKKIKALIQIFKGRIGLALNAKNDILDGITNKSVDSILLNAVVKIRVLLRVLTCLVEVSTRLQ